MLSQYPFAYDTYRGGSPLPLLDRRSPAPTGIASRARRRALMDAAVAACLVAARISAAAEAGGAGAETPSPTADRGFALEEITVTATRRTESVQDVPIAIQALTGETLQQLNIANFEDAVKYLPNVTFAGSGPGQMDIYMRGLSNGPSDGQLAGSVGSFPNVAVYLDDQAVQLPSRNLDVYAADLERIEVLEGPQGTLFGSGAEAGVIRYITNKPQLDVEERAANAGYATTAHGDRSSNVDAMINLPVVADKLAVRAVIYSETRGGYIRNVPGTFVRNSSDQGIFFAGYTNNVPGPPTALNSVNNNNLVADNINPVTYKGARVGVLWKFNDDWNALLVQSYQDMDAEGVFYEMPTNGASPAMKLPDLSVQLYNPSYDRDRFENTALTLNGRIGALSLVYSGAYLVRNVEQVQDYTNYARGAYADYYQCLPPTATRAAQCYSPSATWHEHERDVHQSHELRLTTPNEWRLRGIGGLFWESYAIHDQVDWLYKTAPGFTDIGPPPGVYANNPDIRNDNTAFFNDILRGYKQRAAFVSSDFDIVPKKLTITVGTRYYRFDNMEVGSAVSSFGCQQAGPPPCNNGYNINNLDAQNLRTTYSGFRSRANLTWKVTADAMLYYTWSQGFRPGGFNRSQHYTAALNYESPIAFAPDTLINNELGWKTEWFDHRLQFNGAVYQEDWKNVQTAFFDPQASLGNLTFYTNGPDYRVRGVETQIVARPVRGLTLTTGASWNSSSQMTSPDLRDLTGKPITSIPNPFGVPGSTLDMSPSFQGNLRVRYEFPLGDYQGFVQLGGQHTAHSHTGIGYVQYFDMQGYSTYNAAAGIARDSWGVQLFGENLTDVHANLFTTATQGVVTQFVNRPRTLGLKFNYSFNGR